MDLNITNLAVDADAINKALTAAVAKSAIGGQIMKFIDSEVERMTRGYDNPLERIVRDEVLKLVSNLVRDEYGDRIKEMVRARFSDEIVAKVADAAFTSLIEAKYR